MQYAIYTKIFAKLVEVRLIKLNKKNSSGDINN